MMKKNEYRRWPVLMVLLLAAGCDDADPADTTAQPVSSRDVRQVDAEGQEREPASGGPELFLESPTHDFGELWDFQSQKTSFSFRNTGDSMLVISDIKTSCGCTVPTLQKKRYAPGEGGEIEVAYQPKGKGNMTSVITIISNAWQAGREPPEGESATRLKLNAFVKVFAELDPKFIQFQGVQLGEEHRETVRVTSTDPNLQVEGVKVYGDHFSARLLTAETTGPPAPDAFADSDEIEVVLSDDAPWGESSGNLVVTCRGEVDGREILRNVRAGIRARVYGEIDAGIGRFNLGIVRRGQGFEKSLLLTSRSGKPFRIDDVEVTKSTAWRAEAWAEPLDSGNQFGYRVHVRGEAKDEKGSITGEVKVKTDVEGEEELSIAFGGAVR